MSIMGKTDLVHSCYEGLYTKEQNKVGNLTTSNDIKSNRKTINKMHDYAQKSGNKKLIDYTTKLKKYL